MKKILAICLILMLAMSASAATWEEGLGPQKPYLGSPEVDFTKTIGYMMLLPMKEATVAPGTVTLSVYMPREDVEVGEGVLTLASTEDGKIAEIAVSAANVSARPMTEAELDALLWGSGTAFEITLEKPLEPNRHYTAEMSEGCFYAPDYEIGSPAIEGEGAWSFNTEIGSTVENVRFERMVEGEEAPVELAYEESICVGDQVTFTVTLGDDVASAALVCDAGVILSEESYFPASTEVTAFFPSAGEVKWGVVFMDETGTMLYSIDYTTIVYEMAD